MHPIIGTTQSGLHYCFEGMENKQAPVLVFSNSLGTDLTMWQPQVEALRSQFRLLRYDTRGHGQSAVIPDTTSLAQLGQDVLHLLDHLDIEKAHFCGISMGGMTGLWLGIYAAHRINKLVIANSAARIGNQTAWQQRATLVRSEGMSSLADSAASRWFTDEFTHQHPEVIASMIEQLRHSSPAGYAACCEVLATADLRSEIHRITVPMLVIAGQYDPVTTVADAESIRSAILQQQTVSVTTVAASHLSSIEAPHAFNQAISQFLLH